MVQINLVLKYGESECGMWLQEKRKVHVFIHHILIPNMAVHCWGGGWYKSLHHQGALPLVSPWWIGRGLCSVISSHGKAERATPFLDKRRDWKEGSFLLSQRMDGHFKTESKESTGLAQQRSCMSRGREVGVGTGRYTGKSKLGSVVTAEYLGRRGMNEEKESMEKINLYVY